MVFSRFELKDGKIVMRIEEADDQTVCPEECFCELHDGDDEDTGEWYPVKLETLRDDPEWWNTLHDLGGESG